MIASLILPTLLLAAGIALLTIGARFSYWQQMREGTDRRVIVIAPEVMPENCLPMLSADELIERTKVLPLLQEIRRESQSEAQNFERYYRPLIERYLEFVQLLPASESHHHAEPGGLLIHTLEACVYALKKRQSLMLPQGASPEEQSRLRHRWTYGVLVAALLHDIGKVLRDLKITYFERPDTTGTLWSPLAGSLQEVGASFYHVDFAPPGERDYSAHVRVAMLLMPKCVPQAALQWLSEDRALMKALSAYLSGEDSSGIIPELITEADQASVKRNLLLGPRTRFATARSVPLIERLMEAVRRMLAEGGSLPLNRNGAAGWVYQGEIFFVARRLAEAVRTYLKQNESAQGLPGDDKNDRLFDVWQDHGAVKVNEATGRSVWYVAIEGLEGETFKIDRMAVLRFPLSILYRDPAHFPKSFIGRIVIIGDEKSPEPVPENGVRMSPRQPSEPVAAINDDDDETVPVTVETVTIEQHEGRERRHAVPEMKVKAEAALPTSLRAQENDDDVYLDDMDSAVPPKNDKVTIEELQSARLPDKPVAAAMPALPTLRSQASKESKAPTELAMEILHWLRDGLVSGNLLHNVKDGTVHFVEEGLLLVSPKFFRAFAVGKAGDSSPDAVTEIEKKAQRAIVAAGWTLKSANNQNIIPYQVANTNKILNGMVIAREFAANHIVELSYTNVHLKRCDKLPEKTTSDLKAPAMQIRSTGVSKAM